MIKGVNKAIIEINETGNKYFEKAILYIRSEMSDESEKKLEHQAKEYVANIEKLPFLDYFDLSEDRKRKRRLFLILGGYLLLLCAIIMVIVLK